VARKMLDDDRTGRPFRWIDKCPGHHTHTQPKRYYIKNYYKDIGGIPSH
jgi:hypothetical protein